MSKEKIKKMSFAYLRNIGIVLVMKMVLHTKQKINRLWKKVYGIREMYGRNGKKSQLMLLTRRLYAFDKSID